MEKILVMIIYDDDAKEMRGFESMYYLGKWISSLKYEKMPNIKYITILGPAMEFKAE